MTLCDVTEGSSPQVGGNRLKSGVYSWYFKASAEAKSNYFLGSEALNRELKVKIFSVWKK